ncbi:hypothetical protein [uncultured Gammaproteobacteria bacterium]|jgi:hypothetical protein|nr:hypothetical protein [uncultured Gammaproteobacteria bacterium]CAC9622966.1 hypothetical protein [uncultured Gammaproteobacteria bacterium]CAC9635423.1 hypothetical protein [uncultured Gammaproteobacteria bacterium]CAC9961830.1 hypothetical protein [uncultured Gammaproteobacteria bacterium]
MTKMSEKSIFKDHCNNLIGLYPSIEIVATKAKLLLSVISCPCYSAYANSKGKSTSNLTNAKV